MPPAEIAPDTTVARAEHVVSETLAGATVILDPVSDRYVRLNATGGLIWDALANPTDVRTLTARVASSFDVPESRAEADVTAFVGELVAKDLARLNGG